MSAMAHSPANSSAAAMPASRPCGRRRTLTSGVSTPECPTRTAARSSPSRPSSADEPQAGRLHPCRSARRDDRDGGHGDDGLAGRRWRRAGARLEPGPPRADAAPGQRDRAVGAGSRLDPGIRGRARAQLRRGDRAPDAPGPRRPPGRRLGAAAGRDRLDVVALGQPGRHHRRGVAGQLAENAGVPGRRARPVAHAQRPVRLAGLFLPGQCVEQLPIDGSEPAFGRADRAQLRAGQRPGRQPHPRLPADAMSFAAPPAIPRPHRQRGAALLIAMVIVTLVATLAASMVWQQWRAVQTEAAERARIQSAWILSGALDWARLILKEDARNGGADHLGEPWAVPLAEARLSTFLAADKDNTDDAPDAFLSGAITDANARYNLTNLVSGKTVDPLEMAALQRLCETIGVSTDVAAHIAAGLRDASPPSPPEAAASGAAAAPPVANPPLMPRSVAQLAWLGIDPEALRALEPYVVLLPEKTFVNVNTAPREVLVAAIAGLDLATAERIVQTRQRVPIKSAADLQALAPSLPPGSFDRTAVGSNFFQVRGRLRLGDVVLEQRSLVQRRGLDVVVLQRERVSSRDASTS